jgi:hypothetical protein
MRGCRKPGGLNCGCSRMFELLWLSVLCITTLVAEVRGIPHSKEATSAPGQSIARACPGLPAADEPAVQAPPHHPPLHPLPPRTLSPPSCSLPDAPPMRASRLSPMPCFMASV